MSILPQPTDRPLWLYGKGKLGALARDYFAAVGKEVAGTFDQDEEAPRDARVAVAIVTAPYTQIKERLRARGFDDVWPVYDVMELHHDGRHPLRNGWNATLTAEDWQQIYKVRADCWRDGMSWVHHWAFIEWRTTRIEVPDSVAPLEQQHAIPEVAGRVNAITGVPMAFVKLHLEGGELAALKSMEQTLRRYRPIISVNVDHNDDGIWRTPYWLMQHLPHYDFLFRNHVWCAANSIVYAIPKERKI